MDYDFFAKEKKIIQIATELIANNQINQEQAKQCLLSLIETLEQSCREQARLIRISDRQQEQLWAIKERLRNLANTDFLTELNNRRCFFELLTLQLKKARDKKLNLCLMVLDIDHFKTINDRFGHLVGDQTLFSFGKVLLANVGQQDIIGRLGGEEFGIMLPGITSEEALKPAHNILKATRNQKILLSKGYYKFTVSIGLTQYIHGETADDLLLRADDAMYAAKKNGRNRVEIF